MAAHCWLNVVFGLEGYLQAEEEQILIFAKQIGMTLKATIKRLWMTG
jgi:hypothetical protein